MLWRQAGAPSAQASIFRFGQDVAKVKKGMVHVASACCWSWNRGPPRLSPRLLLTARPCVAPRVRHSHRGEGISPEPSSLEGGSALPERLSFLLVVRATRQGLDTEVAHCLSAGRVVEPQMTRGVQWLIAGLSEAVVF